MDRLETRELEYFIAVAEELHFGRAAERIGIAQPPLSRAISRLERRMGVRLLNRTSRAVSLTPAGKVFLAESRRALDAMDAAVRRARQAGTPARLVVAFRAGAGAGLVTDVLGAYGRRPDAARVEIVFTAEPSAALRNGTADVAVMCAATDLDDQGDLEVTELAQENPVALLPAGHALAARAAVTAAELRSEEFFAPLCPSMPLDEIVDRVAMGRLVVIVGGSAVDRLGAGVVAVPVADAPGTRLVLAWPRHSSPAARGAFVRVATATAAERLARTAVS
jgi:DNA-binding transcriptional LysR family regulator